VHSHECNLDTFLSGGAGDSTYSERQITYGYTNDPLLNTGACMDKNGSHADYSSLYDLL